MQTAFVTGATGLLGNNLVRLLLERGVGVKAMARSPEKAAKQFGALPGLEVVKGDMLNIGAVAPHLAGCDVLFHTAAHFRDSYTGGDHWDELKAVNIDGAHHLLDAAYKAGIRRAVMTSSIAVLDGRKGQAINETMVRKLNKADDYYRSKIMADDVAFEFMKSHPDFSACFVLPGWMHGPGDAGPTSAGQVTLDYLNSKLPGIAPATFCFVDARDVALALIAAADKGRRGERYLAAGRHLTMGDLYKIYQGVSGVKAPTRRLPAAALLMIASVSELAARVTKKPTLISMATVKLMLQEAGKTRFDPTKSECELGLSFRPIEETLRDEIAWFQSNGWLAPAKRAA